MHDTIPQHINMRPIQGYEPYLITTDGRVWSTARRNARGYFRKGGWLTASRNGKGEYLAVKLYRNGKAKTYKIHRLVAAAFIPNPENKPEVNHIDMDNHNNNISNLEWVTTKENINHAWNNNPYRSRYIGKNNGKEGVSLKA